MSCNSYLLVAGLVLHSDEPFSSSVGAHMVSITRMCGSVPPLPHQQSDGC